jgi:hypothetical protein
MPVNQVISLDKTNNPLPEEFPEPQELAIEIRITH